MTAASSASHERSAHRKGCKSPTLGLALTVLVVACTAAEPEPRPPSLPAVPIAVVETADLDPLPDNAPATNGLRQALPYRPKHRWYREIGQELQRLIEAGESQAVIPDLLDDLRNGRLSVRRGASFALTNLRLRPPRVRPELIEAASDADPLVRENALAAMRAYLPSEPVESAMLSALDDPDPRVRWTATRGLLPWRTSRSYLPELAEVMQDSDLRVQIAAAFNFGFVPEGPDLALPGILSQLDDPDLRERRAAAEQLQFFSGTFDPAIATQALALLDDEETRLRQIGAVMLRRMLYRADPASVDAARLTQSLQRALGDADARVRASAAWALRNLGQSASDALPALTAALEIESDPAVRIAMRHARHRISGDGSNIEWSDWPTWSDNRLCIDSETFTLGGLRPWDAEQHVWVSLGDPDRILGDWAEGEGGVHQQYRYEYPGIHVDIADSVVERLTTTSAATPVGNTVRIGMTRSEVLMSEFQFDPPPDALAARLFELPDCEYSELGNTALLEFDESGRLWRARLLYNVP